MRHAIAGNRLGRNSTLRKATIRDIAKATLIQQRVCTTRAKAKEARKLVDRLITLGKNGTLAAKRKAFSILCVHQLVSDLFGQIAPLFKTRPGGYTRIIPLSQNRRGDNAEMVLLELTEQLKIEPKAPAADTASKEAGAKGASAQTQESKAKKPAGGLKGMFKKKTGDAKKSS